MVRRGLENNEDGFTLIETVLTLSILSMFLVIVLGALRLGIRSWEMGEAAVDSTSAKRAVASRLSSDVASMYLYSQNRGEAGSGAYLFSAGTGSLGFVTMSRGPMPWGGLKWVYYSVDGNGLTLREKTVPAADTMDGGGRLIELGPEVVSARFEYLGPAGWEEVWDMEIRKSLPEAVRANLSFRDGSAFSEVLPVWGALR